MPNKSVLFQIIFFCIVFFLYATDIDSCVSLVFCTISLSTLSSQSNRDYHIHHRYFDSINYLDVSSCFLRNLYNYISHGTHDTKWKIITCSNDTFKEVNNMREQQNKQFFPLQVATKVVKTIRHTKHLFCFPKVGNEMNFFSQDCHRARPNQTWT